MGFGKNTGNSGGGGGGISLPISANSVTETTTKKFVSPTEKTTWDAKSDFSGNYTDLTNKPVTTVETLQATTNGQTIFTLTNSYVLGQKSLKVYVNGVLQYSPTNYAETTVNSITLTEGVPIGTIVTIDIVSSLPNIVSTDEKVKLNASDIASGYLEDKLDGTTIQVVSNKLVAKKIDGQTVTVGEINNLSGSVGNIQTQINALSNSLKWKGELANYAALTAIASPTDGDTYVVQVDETKSNTRTIYTRNTTWVYLGQFSFVPDATTTAKGGIQLSGGTAAAPVVNDSNKLGGTLAASYALKTDINWKTPVANFATLATTYTTPVNGWICLTLDDNKIYRYNSTTTSWIEASGNVLPFINKAGFPTTGVVNILYIAMDTNFTYRWDTTTSAYIQVGGGSGSVSTGYLYGTKTASQAVSSPADIVWDNIVANGITYSAPYITLPANGTYKLSFGTSLDLGAASGVNFAFVDNTNTQLPNSSIGSYASVQLGANVGFEGTATALVTTSSTPMQVKVRYVTSGYSVTLRGGATFLDVQQIAGNTPQTTYIPDSFMGVFSPVLINSATSQVPIVKKNGVLSVDANDGVILKANKLYQITCSLYIETQQTYFRYGLSSTYGSFTQIPNSTNGVAMSVTSAQQFNTVPASALVSFSSDTPIYCVGAGDKAVYNPYANSNYGYIQIQEIAGASVLTTSAVIDDTTPSVANVYSSSKVQSLLPTFIRGTGTTSGGTGNTTIYTFPSVPDLTKTEISLWVQRSNDSNWMPVLNASSVQYFIDTSNVLRFWTNDSVFYSRPYKYSIKIYS